MNSALRRWRAFFVRALLERLACAAGAHSCQTFALARSCAPTPRACAARFTRPLWCCTQRSCGGCRRTACSWALRALAPRSSIPKPMVRWRTCGRTFSRCARSMAARRACSIPRRTRSRRESCARVSARRHAARACALSCWTGRGARLAPLRARSRRTCSLSRSTAVLQLTRSLRPAACSRSRRASAQVRRLQPFSTTGTTLPQPRVLCCLQVTPSRALCGCARARMSTHTCVRRGCWEALTREA